MFAKDVKFSVKMYQHGMSYNVDYPNSNINVKYEKHGINVNNCPAITIV